MGINTSSPIQYSIEVSEKKKGETSIRRQPQTKQGLKSIPKPNITDMQKAWIDSLQRNKDELCLFTRNPQTNIYEGKTYHEVHELALAIGSAIINLNLIKNVQELSLIGIFAKNCEEWTILDVSNMLFGHVLVPLYETIGLQFCLEHSEIKTCFVNSFSLNILLKIPTLSCFLENIVSLDENVSQNILIQLQDLKINVFYWKDLVSLGKSNPQKINKNINSSQILSFSYTSGTTGIPKAAMLSHKNFLAVLTSFQSHQVINFSQEDVHLSYLPLSHVFERVFIHALLYAGAKIYYYSGDVKKIKDDLNDVKPTFFISVPRLFTRIYELISQKFQRISGVKRFLLDLAVSTKLYNLKHGQTSHFFYDNIIFNQTKAFFGGKYKFLVTSSAPISQEILSFIKIISCVPVIEGYGQTESTGASFSTHFEDPQGGHIGGPTCCVEYKLKDVPELGYFSNDIDDKGNIQPRGEILLRGPAIFEGYFKEKMPFLDDEGWLMTGDVGMIEGQNQRLKIIDRKKNFFKMQQGEYVAPEKVENVLLRFRGVNEVFVYGNSLENYCICIVFGEKEALLNIAKELRIQQENNENYDVFKDFLVKDLFLKKLESFGKAEGLQGFEIPKKVYFIKKSFSEYGCMTSSFKIQRHLARDIFKQEILSMYEKKV
ncbi:hypothetical protein IMG5_113440 [Ichthyophthirius multifiliis]|uniref:AMP-dependent synthetase/ligase domain-containing protein n=1 Tax=Ichthyophthirius multifiliis TaxID=5932 RepID=G0QU03_ICHMU|nr:hypothetical protein IMG5_113440 [Ichthyophthirius multifiliis]EGR31307.1 hypothetical protein IMG5_113440 [Ichthyophthirius multifiliis]|eukprot:XP_004034793.1 hypothetical protein IMG5_113440 [Ichthyophthirius multifiliis]